MTVRILCVEDNPQNMRLVRKILKSQGYEVIEAEDGFSGLDMAQTANPDLILMDVNLPDIDGLEVTRRIKAQPHLNPIPIVALTANAMFGDEERCLAAGCDGYIAKPVSKQKLVSNLKGYLDARQDAVSDSDKEVDSTTDVQELLTIKKEKILQQTSEKPVQTVDVEPVNDVESAKAVDVELVNDDKAMAEVKEPDSSNSTNGSKEPLPNISAYRNANRRHQFRKSANNSNTNSPNEN